MVSLALQEWYCKPGMQNKRPAGQMWPTEAFNSARKSQFFVHSACLLHKNTLWIGKKHIILGPPWYCIWVVHPCFKPYYPIHAIHSKHTMHDVFSFSRHIVVYRGLTVIKDICNEWMILLPVRGCLVTCWRCWRRSLARRERSTPGWLRSPSRDARSLSSNPQCPATVWTE